MRSSNGHIGLNWVDLTVIGLVAVSALLAFMRGFVREVLGIGAWIAAGFISNEAFPIVQPQFRLWIANPDIADPAAYVVVFLVAVIFFSVIAGILGGLVRGSLLGGIDRTLGTVFGLARGAALVAFAYIACGLVLSPERWPAPVQQARVLPLAYAAASWSVGFLPDNLRPPVVPPPTAPETRAADLLHANPQGRAIARP